MKIKDISNREDIRFLVETFYGRVIPDPIIGHFFTSVVAVDWELHIPVIVDFWEQVLLGGNAYQGNPMDKHFALNKKSPLKPEHFHQWLMIWKKTIEENFSGPVADEALSRATTISGIMEHKICS